MIPAHETFNGTWPYRPSFSHAPGFAMHYADEGSGEPIVLLHGEPTWGYVYRKFIPALAQHNRVIVPDHMGFGKSQTPQDRDYTLKSHVENLAGLLDDLRLNEVTLVMQDWGGPIGTGYAIRHPDRIKRLVYLNTAIGYGTMGRKDLPDPKTSPWFQWIDQGLKTGHFLEVMGNLGSTILSVMHIVGFRNFSIVDDTFVRAYGAPFPTRDECKAAIEFPLDVHLGRIKDYVREGVAGLPALMTKPAIMIEGMDDRAISPERAIADFKGLWPHGPVVELPNAGHYCQEDEPAIIIDRISMFLRST